MVDVFLDLSSWVLKRLRVDGGLLGSVEGSRMRESHVVRRAKKLARTISREGGISHQQALDGIAVKNGHRHWAAMHAAHPPGSPPASIVSDRPEPPSTVPPGGRGRDVLHRTWLDLSIAAGRSLDEHFLEASCILTDHGLIADDVSFVMSMILLVMWTEGLEMSGAAFEAEVVRRSSEAVLSHERMVREARAAKQEVGATNSSLRLVEALSSDLVTLSLDTDSRMARMTVCRTMVLDEVMKAASRRGLPSSRRSTSCLIDTAGVAAFLALFRGEPCPLMSDERQTLLHHLESSRIAGDRTLTDVLEAVQVETDGIDRAKRILLSVPGMSERAAADLLRLPDLCFPHVEGSMNDVFEEVSFGLSLLRGQKEVFSRWIVDAVDKASKGRRPFRYDPFAGIIDDGGEVRLPLVMDALSMLGSQISCPGFREAPKAFMAVFTMGMRSLVNGTLLDACPDALPDRMSMSTMVAVAHWAWSVGADQTRLFCEVNGADVTNEGMEALFDPDVRRIVGRSLAVFSHRLVRSSC